MENDPEFRSGFVVLWGRPNVGKSTLLNSLVGQKIAITSPKPQTTRHKIVGILNLPNAQAVFLDTPGIHNPKHRLGEALVETAESVLPDADVVLFVVDGSVPPMAGDVASAHLFEGVGRPVVLVLNKSDLTPLRKQQVSFEQYSQLGNFADYLAVSALRCGNLDWLLSKLVEHLPVGPQYYPTEFVTDQTHWRMIAELIREQILDGYKYEVPHSAAVMVEEITERRNGLVYVGVSIFVEKESQKKILVGESGNSLKDIGRKSRKSIESYLAKKVFLELWVKVRKRWRMDELWINRFGYAPPK